MVTEAQEVLPSIHMGLTETLGIRITQSSKQHVEATMPVTPQSMQPYGVLHGGATLALLETVASVGAINHANLDKERAFGVAINVRHRRPGRLGDVITGVADLIDISGNSYRFRIASTNQRGELLSEGEMTCKIVSLEHLVRKYGPGQTYITRTA